MAHYHWKELFPPHIWQRGCNYYHDGHILSSRQYGNRIIAEIEGTDIYTVSVTLDEESNRIMDFSCDCPYGEDGTPCKHLAALLCGLENGALENSSKEKNEPVIAQIVNQLSLEQMQQLLIQFAQNDSFILEKIMLTATNQLPQTQKQTWEQDLQEMTDDAADRHGFIDYEQAYDYCCSLTDYLDNRVPELLTNGLVTEAFDLVCLVFQTGMAQDMDDSDGGLGTLASCCMSDWDKILSLASTEMQKKMYHWFCVEYQKSDWTRMFLDEYIFTAPWNAEIAPELLSVLDQEIQSCVENQQRDYRLNKLVPHRIYWMEQAGESSKEYLKKHHQLSAVRDIEIAQAKCAGDWITAIALLEESKCLDADKPGLVARYSEQLIEIYETLHNYSALRLELEYYLFTFRQEHLQYVEKSKKLLSPAEWENMRTKLLNSQSMLYQAYPLLYQEGLYVQLMDCIEQHTDIHALERYEALLKKEFPQRCIAVYETHLHPAMANASNRKAYRSIIQTLKNLRNYPAGKATAQAIAEQWKQKYPRRTSMLDELRKAGY